MKCLVVLAALVAAACASPIVARLHKEVTVARLHVEEPLAGGISLQRTVNSIAPSLSGFVLASPGCSSTDKYGSNNCHFNWGQDLAITVNVSLGQDIVQGDTFSLDFNVNKVIPLKTSCPLCGGECTIEIPIIKQKVSFKMPDCPIKAGQIAKVIPRVALPAKSPLPVAVTVSGTFSAADSAGKPLINLGIDVALNP